MSTHMMTPHSFHAVVQNVSRSFHLLFTQNTETKIKTKANGQQSIGIAGSSRDMTANNVISW
jgi:hypothetical protein